MMSTEESNVGDSVGNEIVMDYTDVFTTNVLFDDREKLISWAREVAREHKIVLVVTRSDGGGETKKGRVSLGCERGGEYRPFKEKNTWKPEVDMDNQEKGNGDIKKSKKRESGSKKCGCQFLLKGKQLKLMGPWVLSVDYAVHNHPIGKSLHGHSFVGRLSSVEKELVLDLSVGNIQPNKILETLKEKNPMNASTIKTVYNTRTRHGVVERAGQSQMQHLMQKLKKHNYYFLDRRCKNTDTVKELFFAHPTGVKLLRAFPNVILMDCTYKTNKYRMPLLEIVGVTSTNMTFSVASVFMQAEKEENYIWALSTLKGLMNKDTFPYLIVTDRELALVNAVHVTFPTSSHFLCRWHINKNVLANCKDEMITDEKWKEFNSCWGLVVYAKNETEFNKRLEMLVNNFKEYDGAVKYVMENWISPYKEKFVANWTNQVLHYGNLTSNRAEGRHAALKRQLGNNIGNFEKIWEHIHTLYVVSHTAIEASFEKSINVVHHKFKSIVFKNLRGMVSIHALQLILDEVKRVAKSQGDIDVSGCGCNLRKTCGLPCAHELVEYVLEDKPIPLSVVDDFWKKLDMEESKRGGEIQHDPEIVNRYVHSKSIIDAKFDDSDDAERILIVKRMQEVANPSTTPLLEPDEPIHTRGRPKAAKTKAYKSTKRNPSKFEYVESKIDSCSPSPSVVYETGLNVNPAIFSKIKKSKIPVKRPPCKKAAISSSYTDKLPLHFLPYIAGTTDVAGDGHCGFRCVAELMGMSSSSWGRVRGELHYELYSNAELYAKVFFDEKGVSKRVEKCMDRLRCFESIAPKKNWFTLPEMGHLTASYYNVALVTLSSAGSFTFLPLRTAIPNDVAPKVICIAFVNNNHFIQVHLKEGHPLPPVLNQWSVNSYPIARSWKSYFKAQIDAYDPTTSSSVQQIVHTINLDDH